MDAVEYLKLRLAIVEENSNLISNVLNEDECKVDEILQEFKKEVRDRVEDSHIYKAAILQDEAIKNTSLYKFLIKLPKGSDLHVHASALLPAHRLIDFFMGYDDVYINKENYRIYLKHNEDFDERNCVLFKDAINKNIISREDFIKHYTVLGISHNEDAWQYFENLFYLTDNFEYNDQYLFEYYVFVFKYFLEMNIFHVELHSVLSKDIKESEKVLNIIKRAYFEVKKDHPELIVSLIGAGLKYNGVDLERPKLYLEYAVKLREIIKDDFDKNNVHNFVIGYDLVNEEDKSLPLKDLAPFLIENKKKYPDFDYFLHCGESLHAQSNNLIDAYLVDVTRVGHGMNLYRYPSLLQKYIEKEICLEVCLISNRALRYVKDIRLHPALEYFRRGVYISLCSDDPAFLEHEILVDDYFAAIMSWDLNLAEIKQLVINSIIYSGVDNIQKSELMKTFRNKWNEFIKEALEA